VYVTNYSSYSVNQYSINQSTGALTSITSAIATGTTPYNITTDPTGRFVYVTNTNDNTVSQYINNNFSAGNFSAGVMTGVASSARYADLAENYVSDQSYDYGIVLMIGGDEEVTIADEDTQRLAGVVSQNPAYLMNSECEGKHVVAIALQGRTPVRVKGNVCKGDFLVSAGDGYAKATDNPRIGSIIGKSLESFDGQYGMVEAMVGRI
jgi:DNA-binding beta-propeller fold protein YncE